MCIYSYILSGRARTCLLNIDESHCTHCTGPEVPVMAEGKDGGCYFLIIFKASVLEWLQSLCIFLCRWCLLNTLPTLCVCVCVCVCVCMQTSEVALLGTSVGMRSHVLIYTAGNHNAVTVFKRCFVLSPNSGRRLIKWTWYPSTIASFYMCSFERISLH
jgi:hypothetical protein